MAITSIGYPSTIAPGSATALWHAAAGRPYVFPAENQVKPNNPQAGTRRVTLSVGRLSGKGITDYNDAVVNLDLPTPAGSSQWFAIVANRWVDPASTPASPVPSGTATRFGWVPGTATKAIPAVTQTAGTFDQQLIALALVESGQQYVRQLVDLRAIGEEGGIYTIFDEMALQTITRPGARARNAITGITYECGYTAARALEWRIADRASMIALPGGVATGGVSGVHHVWAAEAALGGRYLLRVDSVEIDLRVRLTNTQLAVDSTGLVARYPDGNMPRCFIIDEGLRPATPKIRPFSYRTTGSGVRSGTCRIDTDGSVRLITGTPGDPIIGYTAAGQYSVMATLDYSLL